jgi:hypothetical protein
MCLYIKAAFESRFLLGNISLIRTVDNISLPINPDHLFVEEEPITRNGMSMDAKSPYWTNRQRKSPYF